MAECFQSEEGYCELTTCESSICSLSCSQRSTAYGCCLLASLQGDAILGPVLEQPVEAHEWVKLDLGSVHTQ